VFKVLRNNKLLVVIVGPTAVGKTSVAIEVARTLGTVIISADSRQFFREMNIGTAKPSNLEMAEIPHYFINSHTIHEDYDAASYSRDATDLINKLFAEKDHLVLCGGSGLYIRAVCEGFDDIPEIDENIREDLLVGYNKHGLPWLQEKMQILDPEHLAEIDSQNPHRLIRALEVRIGTGKSIAFFRKEKKLSHEFDIVKAGLELPRQELYRRIDDRVDEMVAAGLFKEAENLYPLRFRNALQTVGYQEIFDYMDGKYDYAEAVRLLKRNSRRYAKRQLTWFKKDPDIQWFHPGEAGKIVALVKSIH
jgi:tRNA dimethylallyltransferase